jgi:hypothetical protein
MSSIRAPKFQIRLRCQQQWCGSSNTAADTVKQVVACRIIRAVQSMLECHCIGRAMAFEDQATQTQQCSAVVTTVINTLHQRR